MAYVTYTAVDRGSLLATHTAGVSYSIEFDARKIQRSVKRENARSIAMGGKVETQRYRKDVFWQIESDIVDHADLDEWYEFLDSVDAGESFTWDPYGTVATPDDPRTVILEGDPSEPRVGSIKIYTIRFQAREQ